MKKEYQTNIEILLEKIRKNTAEIDINTDSLSLDVSVDGLETLQTAANGLLTTIDADTGALVIDLAAIEVLLAAANTDHAANEVLLTAIEATLETIKVDTEAIETATEASAASLTLLDNAVDGNYLNVNQNVAGADVAVSDGAKGSTVPRVCIATDDVPIALVNTNLSHLSDNLDTLETTANAIQTAVETLDNAISGSEMQVDVITSALPSGAATQTTLAAAEAHLGQIDTSCQDIATLTNAVDGDYLNVNANIAGTDFVGGAGNVAAGVQRVVLATNDVPTALINTNLGTLETDVEATNTLLTAIKANQLLMLGNSGSVTISGNGAQTPGAGVYCAVYFVGATTPSTLTIGSSTTVASVVYPAGTWLYGDIEAITGDSSALYTLYKGNPA